MKLIHHQRDELACGGWQSGLSRNRPGRQVQQGAADQRGHVLADVEGVQVDQHQFVFRHQAAKVDG